MTELRRVLEHPVVVVFGALAAAGSLVGVGFALGLAIDGPDDSRTEAPAGPGFDGADDVSTTVEPDRTSATERPTSAEPESTAETPSETSTTRATTPIGLWTLKPAIGAHGMGDTAAHPVVVIDGKTYEETVAYESLAGLATQMEFSLSGEPGTLDTLVGIPDSFKSEENWRFSVLTIENGVERELGRSSLLGPGMIEQMQPIELGDVFRLVLRIESVGGTYTGARSAPLVWVSPTITPL